MKEIISPLPRKRSSWVCPEAQSYLQICSFFTKPELLSNAQALMDCFLFIRKILPHFNLFFSHYYFNLHWILQFCLWIHVLQDDNLFFPVICHKWVKLLMYSILIVLILAQLAYALLRVSLGLLIARENNNRFFI